jgi:hypothetical protein
VEVKIHVWLSIVSEVQAPEEISAYVGIECDLSWKPGDVRYPTTIVETDYGWVLESGVPEQEADVEVHIEATLARVRASAERIRNLSSQAEVTIQVVIYSTERFGLAFDPWAVREIATLGAAIDLDVYYVDGIGSRE